MLWTGPTHGHQQELGRREERRPGTVTVNAQFVTFSVPLFLSPVSGTARAGERKQWLCHRSRWWSLLLAASIWVYPAFAPRQRVVMGMATHGQRAREGHRTTTLCGDNGDMGTLQQDLAGTQHPLALSSGPAPGKLPLASTGRGVCHPPRVPSPPTDLEMMEPWGLPVQHHPLPHPAQRWQGVGWLHVPRRTTSVLCRRGAAWEAGDSQKPRVLPETSQRGDAAAGGLFLCSPPAGCQSLGDEKQNAHGQYSLSRGGVLVEL